MADLDLTEAIGAGGEAANGMAGDWYCPRRHDTPRRACEFCVAEVAVTAAAPLIEAQVRAQIAAEAEWSEGLRHDDNFEYAVTSDCDGSNVAWHRRTPRYVRQYGAWEPATEAAYNAARIARGDS